MKPELKFVEGRQRFLPVPRAVLRAQMLRDPRLSDTERGQLSQLFELVAARFHFEFRARLERLQTLYDAFDPDRDTLPLDPPPTGRTVARAGIQPDLRPVAAGRELRGDDPRRGHSLGGLPVADRIGRGGQSVRVRRTARVLPRSAVTSSGIPLPLRPLETETEQVHVSAAGGPVGPAGQGTAGADLPEGLQERGGRGPGNGPARTCGSACGCWTT